MDDTDLVARIYPYSTQGDARHARRIILNHLSLVLPTHQESQTLQYGRDDRERTQPPVDPDDKMTSEHKNQICIEVRFSKIPRSSNGLVFGCSKESDAVLPNLRGLSKKHFSVTFDNQRRLIVKDLDSLYGTQVTYNGHGAGLRRRFQWIISGDENAHEKDCIVQIHKTIQFKIVAVKHDINSESYKDKVKKYCLGSAGNASTEALLRSMSIPSQPDTIRQTGAHTPSTEPIYLTRVLGSGGEGTVIHHWNVSTGKEHALKQAHDKHRFNNSRWLAERDILGQLSHKHIVKLLSIHPRLDQICLEYIPGGSLDKLDKITVSQSVSVLRQVLSALTYLHGQRPKIVHRDIKPGNILVRERTRHGITVVLGDFGLHGCGSGLQTLCGTPIYLPPELHKAYVKGAPWAKHSQAVDIWSLGMVVFDLLFGIPEYRGQQDWCEWIVNLLQEEHRKRPDRLKALLLGSMLCISPEARGSAQECYEKVMALPRTIVEDNTVPHRGIFRREDSSLYFRSNTEETSTRLGEELNGEPSTSQITLQATPRYLTPATTWSASGKNSGPHRSLLPNPSSQIVNGEQVRGKSLPTSARPSPSLHPSARASLKRPVEDAALHGRSSKRQGRGSTSKAPAYSGAPLSDAEEVDETVPQAARSQV